jgi:hypothetical protein
MIYRDGMIRTETNKMADQVITPASIPEYNTTKPKPCYLFVLETKGNKKDLHFVATKYDQATATANVVGFFTEAEEADIAARYDELIRTTEKAAFVEMQFPWCRILHIQSLLYRQK